MRRAPDGSRERADTVCAHKLKKVSRGEGGKRGKLGTDLDVVLHFYLVRDWESIYLIVSIILTLAFIVHFEPVSRDFGSTPCCCRIRSRGQGFIRVFVRDDDVARSVLRGAIVS